MRLAAAVLFLVASVAHIATAQQTPAPEPVGTGVITGRVVNSANGSPVKAASVLLFSQGLQNGAPPTERSARISEDGFFSFDKLPAGEYRIFVIRNGIASGGGYAVGVDLAFRNGTRVSLTDGQKVSDLLLKIPATAVITGRVLDGEGLPMQQVQVQALRWMMNAGRTQLVPMGEGLTNDLGEYRLFNLPPGRYYVMAQSNNENRFLGMEGNSSDKAYASGYFPDSPHVQNASAIVLAAGEEAHADFNLRQVTTTFVRGKVTGIAPSQDAMMRVILASSAGVSNANVEKDGRFELRNLLPGTYRLILMGFTPPSSQKARTTGKLASDQLAQRTLVVPESGVSDLEVYAAPGGRTQPAIRGTIRADQADADLSRLIVSLQSSEPSPEFDEFEIAQTFQEVQKDGSFTFETSPTGNYYIAINANGPGFEDWYTKSVSFNGRDVTDDPIQLDDSSRGTLQLVVSAKGASLEGTVTASDDKPMPDVKVMTIPAGGKGRPELFQETTTDQSGRFKIRGIAPGDYKIVALTEDDADAFADPSFTKTLAARGTSVRFDPGAHQTVALKVTSDTTPQ